MSLLQGRRYKPSQSKLPLLKNLCRRRSSPKKFGFAYATLSVRIRRGDIALHQFSGEARPKINVAEALQVMSAVKRQYASPTLRVVRHDEDGTPIAQTEKPDLFA